MYKILKNLIDMFDYSLQKLNPSYRKASRNLLDLQNKTGSVITLRKLPQKIPAGVYCFSCDDINKSIAIRLSETNESGTKSKAFSVNYVKDNRRYVTGTIDFEAEYINISSSDTPITNMQLEKGSVPTEYEPYRN